MNFCPLAIGKLDFELSTFIALSDLELPHVHKRGGPTSDSPASNKSMKTLSEKEVFKIEVMFWADLNSSSMSLFKK